MQNLSFKRDLYAKINWNARFIGIKGPKGVGKSTLLLQYIKENLATENVLYVSLDNMWFASHSLLDLVEYHYINGGTHLFLDEVHKYTHWQTYIKNFLVDEKYIIEVGGADKTFKQIKDIPDSYLAIDNVEVGRGNKIPLWLFGFLY